jgi:hypothetical protein
MTVQSKISIVWLAALAACSLDPEIPGDAPDPISEEDRARPGEFFVELEGATLSTSAALLTVAFRSDGSNDAELSFEVGTGDTLTSAVLWPSLEQLGSGDFEVEITGGPLSAGAANVIVAGGSIAQGSMHVSIEPDGTVSGATSGAETVLSFAGRIVLHCMVPPPPGSNSAPVPSGDTAGEVLILDAEFETDACAQARNAIGIR